MRLSTVTCSPTQHLPAAHDELTMGRLSTDKGSLACFTKLSILIFMEVILTKWDQACRASFPLLAAVWPDPDQQLSD
ncbi:hypothetical protein GALMADRAFT_224982 [Galerina marginata CBS 339.88]|uniref:Uncharacterized protein n=1 Tax=Galerina marginata (strain CBS 339.88) TaxID=685588 RepID=A0A067T5W7_GALM3|nr:hypothetical protein GALMADRAFT_224982 [Galerina marginata CBS 339.88]